MDSIWRQLHDAVENLDDEGVDWCDDLPRPDDVDRLMAEPDDNEPAIDTRWDQEREDREAKGKP